MGFNFTIYKMAQIYLHEVTHERVAARNDHSNDVFVSEMYMGFQIIQAPFCIEIQCEKIGGSAEAQW